MIVKSELNSEKMKYKIIVHFAITLCSQLSRIILEAPDFGPYLPVSRLESEISRIIAEGCHFL